MKEYNRQSHRWEEKSTEQVGDLAKSELCRGKRPHKLFLCLPPYTDTLSGFEETETMAIDFYRLKDEQADLEDAYGKKLEAIGIKDRSWSHRTSRYWKCTVCGKRMSKF